MLFDVVSWLGCLWYMSCLVWVVLFGVVVLLVVYGLLCLVLLVWFGAVVCLFDCYLVWLCGWWCGCVVAGGFVLFDVCRLYLFFSVVLWLFFVVCSGGVGTSLCLFW